MVEPNQPVQRALDDAQQILTARLQELEGRVKAAVALLAKFKADKASLERRVGELEALATARAEQVKVLELGRKQDQERILRLQEERDAVRARIDRVLEEIAKLDPATE